MVSRKSQGARHINCTAEPAIAVLGARLAVIAAGIARWFTTSVWVCHGESLARVRQAFGGNFPRLQQLKDRYDPANLFHCNQNIPPSS